MLFAILKKVLIISTTNTENVNSVILKEKQNDTIIIKIKYQINKKYIIKNRDKLLQKQNDYNKKEAQIIKNYKIN